MRTYLWIFSSYFKRLSLSLFNSDECVVDKCLIRICWLGLNSNSLVLSVLMIYSSGIVCKILVYCVIWCTRSICISYNIPVNFINYVNDHWCERIRCINTCINVCISSLIEIFKRSLCFNERWCTDFSLNVRT